MTIDDKPERIAVGIAQAAAMVGLSRGTLYKAIGDEELESFLRYGRRLIFVDELIAFVKREPKTVSKNSPENSQ